MRCPARRVARLTRRGMGMVVFGCAAVIAAYASARVELLYVGVLAILVPVFAIAFARFRRVSVSASR